MSSNLLDGPCPSPKCLTLVKYSINHLPDGTRVIEATCGVCGSYRAYDGARNVERLS